MMGLTERQFDALRFIARFQAAKGFSPSRREIGEALGLTSMASAQRLVMGLVDRAALRILPERSRAIEILIPLPGVPDNDQDAAGCTGFGLTERQQDALRFITGYIERNGIPPSFREIAAGIGTSRKATNYIERILAALEGQGWISRSEGMDRGIAVLRTLPIPRAPDGEPLHFIRIGGQG
jgi:SOS-response transcriptional repressor LexA